MAAGKWGVGSEGFGEEGGGQIGRTWRAQKGIWMLVESVFNSLTCALC